MSAKISEIKYRPGLCLLCGAPIQNRFLLWCVASHRKQHDRRLKTNPVRYKHFICRTAYELEDKIQGVALRLVSKQMYEEESQKPADKQDKDLMEYLKKKIS